MVTLWVVRDPITYLLVFGLDWGPMGIWLGVAAGDIIGAIAALVWFTRGTWKDAVVETDRPVTADGGAPED